jgi:hypothetical protein
MHAYQSREAITQVTNVSLQKIIAYLTDLRLYIETEKSHATDLKLSHQIDKEVEIHDYYNLSQYERECPPHRYITRIIQRNPLIIYIEHFLTTNEIQHLITLT